MCSKCYRAYCADQERENGQAGEPVKSPMPSTAQQLTNADVAEVLAAADAVSKAEKASEVAESVISSPVPTTAASPGDDETAKPVQLNTNRCFDCNKKVGLTGLKCRCGYVYCATHRYAEKHSCSYDYKTAGRQTLANNNPVVASAKVNKF